MRHPIRGAVFASQETHILFYVSGTKEARGELIEKNSGKESEFVMEKKGAILAVSFGTSYEETRKKTIDRIEEDIRKRYPQYELYRAWTSRMIRRKIEKRDGVHIPDVREAMEQIAEAGYTDVIVQPTHVLNGVENEWMEEEILAYKPRFSHIVTGAPLLSTHEDSERVIACIAKELWPPADEALVLMGHGTEHFANSIYAALDYQFKDMGYSNIFMGTVEAYPALESLIRRIEQMQPQKVVLAPFMIVAGDHAQNDLAGEDEDSWKSRFEKAGYEVQCILRGLGEYEGIRELFLDHIAESIRKLEGALQDGNTDDRN